MRDISSMFGGTGVPSTSRSVMRQSPSSAQLLDVPREHGPARESVLARDHGLRVGEAELGRSQRGGLQTLGGGQVLDECLRGGCITGGELREQLLGLTPKVVEVRAGG
jgi:hypothetical protein